MKTALDSEEAGTDSVAVPPSSYEYSDDAPGSTEETLSDEAVRPGVSSPEDRLDAVQHRRSELSKAFHDMRPKLLGERLDEFMNRSETDSASAHAADPQVKEWVNERFVKDAENPPYLANSECVSQVCFVDLEMPPFDFVITNATASDKTGFVEGGFLPGYIAVRAGENYIRMYFFRDTFEVSDLQH